jgi:hypothetical protein
VALELEVELAELLDLVVFAGQLGGEFGGHAPVVAGVLLLQQHLVALLLQLGGFLAFEFQLGSGLATVLEAWVPPAGLSSSGATTQPAGPSALCSIGSGLPPAHATTLTHRLTSVTRSFPAEPFDSIYNTDYHVLRVSFTVMTF